MTSMETVLDTPEPNMSTLIIPFASARSTARFETVVPRRKLTLLATGAVVPL